MIISEEADCYWVIFYFSKMEIIYLEKVDSTHLYLKEWLKTNTFKHPIAFVTREQTHGIGSRENSWDGTKGDLFFSFAIFKSNLPNDVRIESASIYFSLLFKDVLEEFGSKIWLKWPNDFYLEDKKIGGVITGLNNNIFMCGIGLNLVKTSDKYGVLDIEIEPMIVLKNFFLLIESNITWKYIFSKLEIEFNKSKVYQTTINKDKISLRDAILLEDGSIMIKNKKVYSLR